MQKKLIPIIAGLTVVCTVSISITLFPKSSKEVSNPQEQASQIPSNVTNVIKKSNTKKITCLKNGGGSACNNSGIINNNMSNTFKNHNENHNGNQTHVNCIGKTDHGSVCNNHGTINNNFNNSQ